jgi:hypothetical protein
MLSDQEGLLPVPTRCTPGGSAGFLGSPLPGPLGLGGIQRVDAQSVALFPGEVAEYSGQAKATAANSLGSSLRTRSATRLGATGCAPREAINGDARRWGGTGADAGVHRPEDDSGWT